MTVTATIERLKPMLDALTTEGRHEVMAYLQGLGGEPELSDEAWEEAWVAECERRSADLDAGRSTDLSHEEMTARRKERYG